MSELNNTTPRQPFFSMAAFISLISMVSLLGCMFALTWITIPTENKDLFNMGMGALIAWGTNGVNFFLGSSDGSKRKTAAMAAEMAQDVN